MKKLLAIALIVPTMGLAACSSNDPGFVNTSAPYASERTAGAEKNQPVRRAERVFRRSQSK